MNLKLWLFAMITIWGMGQGASAANIEFVSKDEAKRLAEEYSRAEGVDAKVLQGLEGKELTCDMYGMRSRLQIERRVKLYRFIKSSAGLKNSGAQVIESYQMADGKFIGQRGRLVDEVRSLKGVLLARLSLASDGQGGDRSPVVLAYSRCEL